jgi:hypothetical protein
MKQNYPWLCRSAVIPSGAIQPIIQDKTVKNPLESSSFRVKAFAAATVSA